MKGPKPMKFPISLLLLVVLSFDPCRCFVNTVAPARPISSLQSQANRKRPVVVDGEPPLTTASRDGNLDRVKELLGGGSPVDEEDSIGWTPLMWSSFGGHIECSEALIAAGAQAQESVIYEVPLLSEAECEWFISTAIDYTEREGWCTSRHRTYSTEDIPVEDIPPLSTFVADMVRERLQPFIQETYGGNLELFDVFLVRYTMDRQRELEEHVDRGMVTFNLALSPLDAYEGGGAYFKGLDQSLKPPRGSALVHPAKLRHGGTAITSGTRFVLVGFGKVKNSDPIEALKLTGRLWGCLTQQVTYQRAAAA
ncbi:unnamed protein product [Chrysoparadoxa australica]